jgi:peroxiredoxin
MKLAQLAQMIFIVAASFFVYGFVSMAKDGEARRACTPLCGIKPNYAAANRRAPDFELSNLAGKKVKLSDYRGKVVILNFWSKSCPPCLEEMPSLASLAHSIAHRDDIVLVTVTTDESAADAKDTLKSILGVDAPFEVLVDPDAKVVSDKFGTKLYPETWFIDPKGVIRARVDEARDWSTALSLEFAESLAGPLNCSIRFDKRVPSGTSAHLCEEMGH